MARRLAIVAVVGLALMAGAIYLTLPQAERRDRLTAVVDKPVDLTPSTEDPDEAQPWLAGW